MARCEATIVEFDDRWGGFTDRCELDAGHDGDHRVPREACQPVGYLGWSSSPPVEGGESDG
jgi:hypothetical protein